MYKLNHHNNIKLLDNTVKQNYNNIMSQVVIKHLLNHSQWDLKLLIDVFKAHEDTVLYMIINLIEPYNLLLYTNCGCLLEGFIV